MKSPTASRTALDVIGAGISAGMGQGARNAALAFRAGWHGGTPVPFQGGSLYGVTVPGIDGASSLRDRLLHMGTEALRGVTAQWDLGPMPMILALPEDKPGDEPFDAAELGRAIAAGAGASVDGRVSVVRAGPTAGGTALLEARRMLEDRNGPPAVIVGAADCTVTPGAVARMVEEGRIVPAGWTASPGQGGARPGEGAAFVVLARQGALQRSPLSTLVDVVVCKEPSEPEEGVNLLSTALDSLTADLERAWILSDVSGEAVRMDAMAESLRDLLGRRTGLVARHDLLPDQVGDVGAATLVFGLALASATFAVRGVEESAAAIVSGTGSRDLGLVLAKGTAEEPVPPAGKSLRTTGAHRIARATVVAVVDLARDVARVSHRLRDDARAALERSSVLLLAAAHALTEAPIDESLPGRLDALERAATALAGIANAADRSAARRGRPREPALGAIASAATKLATRASRERPRVVTTVAALRVMDDPPIDSGFALSVGGPARIAIPYAPGPPPEISGARPDIDEDEDDDDDDAQDDDEPEVAALAEPATAAEPSPVVAAPALLDSVQDALESIGNAWRLRTPPDHIPWSPTIGDDDGMLHRLDWLHALVRPVAEGGSYDGGPAITESLRKPDSPLDSEGAFAKTWVLACGTDPRLARAAVEKARRPHAELARAYEDALSLGSSPEIDAAVRDLCVESDPRTLELALNVMARRQVASLGAVAVTLAHPDPSVRRAAARAACFIPSADAARTALEGRLAIETSPFVGSGIVLSLLTLHGPHAGAQLARMLTDLLVLGADLPEESQKARLELARAAAALGRPQEAMAFTALARTPDEIEVVGWFGRASSVSKLIEWLDSTDGGDIRRAAARALARILGVVRDPGGKSRLVDGGFDTVDDDQLEYEPRLYRAYWDAEGAELGSAHKHRFGRRFEPNQPIAELTARARRIDRCMAALEVTLAPGAAARALPDLQDWTARQIAGVRIGASGGAPAPRPSATRR